MTKKSTAYNVFKLIARSPYIDKETKLATKKLFIKHQISGTLLEQEKNYLKKILDASLEAMLLFGE